MDDILKMVKDNIVSYDCYEKTINELKSTIDKLDKYVKSFENENNIKLNKIIKNINETNKLIIEDINDLNKSIINIERYIKLPWYKKLFKHFK